MQTILDFDNRWLISWNSFVSSSSFWSAVAKFSAEYLIYFLPVFLIIFWFVKKDAQKPLLRALFAAGLGLICGMIIGKALDRPRPFETRGITEILFHRPDYSFPSDHAIVLFAISFSLWFSGYKKIAAGIFVGSVIVTSARIATGIHFPSDILAGLIIGLVFAFIVNLLDRYLAFSYQIIIKIARKLRLA